MTDLKKHIIVKVDNVHWSINGSIRKRLDNQTQNTDYYYFNASGNLKACGTDMQISVYGYNSANTRTYKVNMFNANQWVNGQPQPIQPMVQSAMFYPNTYINFTQAGEYTKHYYNGTERICSRLGEQQIPISVENDQEWEAHRHDVKEMLRNAIGQHLYDEPTDMQEGEVLHLEYLQPCGNSNAIYYYHPNHLSSTMYVTDAQQSVVQSFLYAPYGEIISEYNTHVMGEAFPKYAFNAKELDEETGMYYYEARYYAPPTFTSRDPLFEKYFWMTPYAYCANNPVKYVDPDGREWETIEDGIFANKLIWKAERMIKQYGKQIIRFQKQIDDYKEKGMTDKISNLQLSINHLNDRITLLNEGIENIKEMGRNTNHKFHFNFTENKRSDVSQREKDNLDIIDINACVSAPFETGWHECVHIGDWFAKKFKHTFKDGFLQTYDNNHGKAEEHAYKSEFSFSMRRFEEKGINSLYQIDEQTYKLFENE